MSNTTPTIKAFLESIKEEQLDQVQLENDFADSLIEQDIDIMSGDFLQHSSEQIAQMALKAEKEKREKVAKEKQEKKLASEHARRAALLSDKAAYAEYSKLMSEMPAFDFADQTHWSAKLVRIMHLVNYKVNIDALAKPETVLGEIESISHVAIVKSHLSIAIFDSIYSAMSDYSLENQGFSINDIEKPKETAVYSTSSEFKIDETSDTATNPKWGMY